MHTAAFVHNVYISCSDCRERSTVCSGRCLVSWASTASRLSTRARTRTWRLSQRSLEKNGVEGREASKDKNNEYAYTFPGGNHATSVVEGVGMFLFALYHVAIIIVLINMLIAMMSHSFEDIQVNWLWPLTSKYRLQLHVPYTDYCYQFELYIRLSVLELQARAYAIWDRRMDRRVATPSMGGLHNNNPSLSVMAY